MPDLRTLGLVYLRPEKAHPLDNRLADRAAALNLLVSLVLQPVQVMLLDRSVGSLDLRDKLLLGLEVRVVLLHLGVVRVDPQSLRCNFRPKTGGNLQGRITVIQDRPKQRHGLKHAIHRHAKGGRSPLGVLVKETTGSLGVLALPHPVMRTIEELHALIGVLAEAVMLVLLGILYLLQPQINNRSSGVRRLIPFRHLPHAPAFDFHTRQP